LDDFGSGLSSLAYLKELPVGGNNIDGLFVKHQATCPMDQAIVRTMNDIAHALLGKRIIAEIVENEKCLRPPARAGVDYAQGFLPGVRTLP